MALQTARDIPLRVSSENASTERRITPSWTVAQLKGKLESVTGIPPSCQTLVLRVPGREDTPIAASDEDSVQVGSWSLQADAEIHVSDTRPPAARFSLNLDASSVPKYEMPESTYESLPGSVLAFKKTHKIGRFDPNAPEIEKKKAEQGWIEVDKRELKLSGRVCILPGSSRRGTIAYIGAIASLPGPEGSPWLGVTLDEPQGKNDGSVSGERYFECPPNRGVFVRPDRCEAGDWSVLMDEEDEDLEEI